jgi:hypothetical protein
MSFLKVLADLLSDRERVKRNQKSAQKIKEALRSKSPYPVFRSEDKEVKQEEKHLFTKKITSLSPKNLRSQRKEVRLVFTSTFWMNLEMFIHRIDPLRQ